VLSRVLFEHLGGADDTHDGLELSFLQSYCSGPPGFEEAPSLPTNRHRIGHASTQDQNKVQTDTRVVIDIARTGAIPAAEAGSRLKRHRYAMSAGTPVGDHDYVVIPATLCSRFPTRRSRLASRLPPSQAGEDRSGYGPNRGQGGPLRRSHTGSVACEPGAWLEGCHAGQ
jgi:hypothetical protein